MKIYPTTKTGRWGLWLSIAFAVVFVLKVLISFPLPSPVIIGAGIAGVVLTVIALFKRERSALFFVVCGSVGIFVVVWLGVELIFPH